ncbi:MAG: AAA family ATPase [Myxococcales bacterium]|nr:AAA family ATPase [Myxococcales bacterium]
MIVGGPNGSGKSTFTKAALDLPEFAGLEVLNPDEIGKELRGRGLHKLLNRLGPLRAYTDWVAVRDVGRRVEEATAARRSFIVETVLSTDKYMAVVRRARELEFYVALMFVTLPNPALNWLRVQARRALGGHGVPEGKVRERWERSHDVLGAFAPLADEVRVFDNSSADGVPLLVASKARRLDAFILHAPGVLPRVERALALRS